MIATGYHDKKKKRIMGIWKSETLASAAILQAAENTKEKSRQCFTDENRGSCYVTHAQW
jgi:hypothetical protein